MYDLYRRGGGGGSRGVFDRKKPESRAPALTHHLVRVSMKSDHLSGVMPVLVAGIHVFLARLSKKDVDGRDRPDRDSG
jgi:hypothetical protein